MTVMHAVIRAGYLFVFDLSCTLKAPHQPPDVAGDV